jgi:ribonuclease Z
MIMPAPIELRFLGTGSAIPTVKRGQPAILFHREADFWLFDCGEGTQSRLEQAHVSPLRISKIFITHWHADHFAGLLPLIETMHLNRRTEPLEIYGPDASRFVEDLIELSYWGVGFPIKAIDCEPEPYQKLVETGEYEVWALQTKHSVPSCGFGFIEKPHWHIEMKKVKKLGLERGPKLSEMKEKGKLIVGNKTVMLADVAKQTPGRKIVYTGDTFVYEPLFRWAAGADLLIHDGTFVEPAPMHAHPSVTQVAKMAKRFAVKRLVLVHLSRRYSNNTEIKRAVRPIFKKFSVPDDGDVVRL